MAKMHFKYASMNSGKSIDLMRSAHNYEENGYKVLVVKPGVDTKAGEYEEPIPEFEEPIEEVE